MTFEEGITRKNVSLAVAGSHALPLGALAKPGLVLVASAAGMPRGLSEKRLGRVSRRLQEAYERSEERALELGDARMVIFSDHHRGQRDGADDFQRCERAYNAALGYYLATGYTLVVLGVAEELWECRPAKVIDAYRHTLGLEAEFHALGRYIRIYGNHDDLWSNHSSVRHFLHPIFEDLKVHEAIRFRVSKGGSELGTLLVVHGHQGARLSDTGSELGKFLVRNFWRPVQRLTKIPSTTPAKSFALRKKHDRAMYDWASKQAKLVLVAGHTHRPVLESKTLLLSLEEELARLQARLDRITPTENDQIEMARLRAQLEWVKAQDMDRPEEVEAMDSPSRPSYFNTGCCSFGDGDVTGLEIAEGQIRLVRWPDDEDQPLPKILRELDLEDVFARLATSGL